MYNDSKPCTLTESEIALLMSFGDRALAELTRNAQ